MHANVRPFPYDGTILHIDSFKSISVIIGNYNHSEMVKIVVEGLLNQVLVPEFEIVIGDSGSNEENQQIIKDLMDHVSCKIKYVYVDNEENRAKNPHFNGYSSCINAAAKVAQGEVLVYCDSSIIVPPRFIYELAYPVSEHDIFIRAPLANLTPDQTNLIKNEGIWNDYKGIVERFSHLKKSAGRPAWAVRRKSFIEVGGMDESMVVYGAIDDDLVTRLMMKGLPNFQSNLPVLHMWHKEPRSNHGDVNAKKMREHIKNKQIKVNDEKWGEYAWVIENE